MNLLCKLKLHKWKYWDEKEETGTVYHRICERCNLRQTKFWRIPSFTHYVSETFKWADEKEGEHWTQLGDGEYQRFK